MLERRMGRIERIHFVGIGGAGMSGIAEVLHGEGFVVTGSDIASSSATARFAELGIDVDIGHRAQNVHGADVLVRSSAIGDDNVEVQAAHDDGIPVIGRAVMLGELMRDRHGVAVAGTHGKTTTTSFITSIFLAAGLDPTWVIGGLLRSEGANAGLGSGTYLIAEADESDASFLHLLPKTAVITNVDRDHLDTYGQSFDQLENAFVEFAHRLPFYGLVVACVDDPSVARLVPRIARPIVTYGLSEGAHYRAVDVSTRALPWTFRVQRPGHCELVVEVPIPGWHNVLNALAAIVVATEEGLDDESIERGLRQFDGVGRRFECTEARVGDKHVTVVDDYGHHPTEIRAVVATARVVWPTRRLVMVFQPHRYSRTRDLFDEFVDVLADVDVLVLLDTYSAGEETLAGFTAAALAERVQATLVGAPEDAFEALLGFVADDDVVLVQGAGNVNRVSQLSSAFHE